MKLQRGLSLATTGLAGQIGLIVLSLPHLGCL